MTTRGDAHALRDSLIDHVRLVHPDWPLSAVRDDVAKMNLDRVRRELKQLRRAVVTERTA